MKAYTLCILAKLAGKDEMTGQTEGDDIVNWVNNKVCVVPLYLFIYLFAEHTHSNHNWDKDMIAGQQGP